MKFVILLLQSVQFHIYLWLANIQLEQGSQAFLIMQTPLGFWPVVVGQLQKGYPCR